MTRSATAICLTAFVALVGCQQGKRLVDRQLRGLNPPPLELPTAYLDPMVENGQVQRILALPLVDDSFDGEGAVVVSQAIRDEILKLRRFELVQPTPADAASQAANGPKKTGRIEVGSIIELGRRYGVDAVLFGAIDHYRPYEPPSLGMSISLVDVETGRIIWHVRDFVDSADQRTSLAMRYFFEDETSLDDTVFGSELMATAPQWFSRFAANRVALTLEPPPPMDGSQGG